LGIDLQDDLLKPLGDVWCVYNSPSEGGLLVTGLTGVVQVKDHARLEATLDRLISFFHDRVEAPALAGEMGVHGFPPRVSPRIIKTSFAGHVIYHFDVPAGDSPMAPAWCLTEKELLVSFFPETIKSHLARNEDSPSLAAVPEVAQVLQDGAVAFSYCDTRKVAEFVYPLLCFGAKAISSELSQKGIPLDAGLLPSAAAIFPHLQPSIGVVRRTADGIELSSRGTLVGVGGGPLLAPLPIMFFWGARTAAVPVAMPMGTRAQSMNNLKQIALAAHNYLATFGTFPPAYVFDKATGKPLLSWRVALLPFLEQDALYREFHLDEPWDSPHNKPLAARMPMVYRSPDRAAAPNKTRYVTLRFKDSVFPGKQGIGPAEITDGMSRTLMVVEADVSRAVVWTKPDDLNFGPTKPKTGLADQPEGGFLAAMCDGAVRFISASTDAETLRNLANRHDGHAVTLP
jgi:hypothetical protein